MKFENIIAAFYDVSEVCMVKHSVIKSEFDVIVIKIDTTDMEKCITEENPTIPFYVGYSSLIIMRNCTLLAKVYK